MRGSPEAVGSCSLATSSDCTAMVAGPLTASTVYEIAATARCARETMRWEVRRTVRPEGVVHSTDRLRTPLR